MDGPGGPLLVTVAGLCAEGGMARRLACLRIRRPGRRLGRNWRSRPARSGDSHSNEKDEAMAWFYVLMIAAGMMLIAAAIENWRNR